MNKIIPNLEIEEKIKQDDLSEIIRKDAEEHYSQSVEEYFQWLSKDYAYYYISTSIDKGFMFINSNRKSLAFILGLMMALVPVIIRMIW